jgi:hypothetical protein
MLSAQSKAPVASVRMLADARKQGRLTLPDPGERRSLLRPFCSGGECPSFVKAGL